VIATVPTQTDRDLRLILGVQALRAAGYGFGSVLLGAVLAGGGLSAAQVGTVFTAMLVGLALGSVAVGRWGDRIGRRRVYVGLLALMGVAGAVFAVATWWPLLAVVALTGTLSTDPNESGPITSLEQAMIGGAPREARARVFGRYNAVAYLAGSVGALLAAGPGVLRSVWPGLPPDQRWLFALPVVAAGCVALAMRLDRDVEAPASETPLPGVPHRPLVRSRSTVRRLAALFSMDAFAGGFIVQAFLVFWFGRRFGATPEAMATLFFAVGLVQAASSVAAGRLASRIGLLNTMVFTHLPSNVLLAAVPFAPTLPVAAGLLIARSALSQMDVPARQAYVVTMVEPSERTAAAAYTNTARYVVRPVGPVAAGVLMQGLWIGLPFVVAGAVKCVYDVLLFAMFRAVPLPDEASP
jgi:MFS family permease